MWPLTQYQPRVGDWWRLSLEAPGYAAFKADFQLSQQIVNQMSYFTFSDSVRTSTPFVFKASEMQSYYEQTQKRIEVIWIIVGVVILVVVLAILITVLALCIKKKKKLILIQKLKENEDSILKTDRIYLNQSDGIPME